MKTTARDPIAVFGQLLLAATAAAFLLVGPPKETEELRVEVATDSLPERRAVPTEAEPRELLVELSMCERKDLDGLSLAPDPIALRTRVRQVVPDRVLDPDAVELRPLAPARRGRPLRIEVRIAGALPGDRVLLLRPEAERLAGTYDRAHFRSEKQLASLEEGPLSLGVRWEGRRKNRRGSVEVWYRVDVGPPPGFWIGPGVEKDGALSRALELQGFRPVAARKDAELFLLSLGRAAPEWFAAELDRGKGCLLIAEPGSDMHPSHLAFAPVVPGKAMPKAAEGGTAKAGSEGERASTPDRGKTNPPTKRPTKKKGAPEQPEQKAPPRSGPPTGEPGGLVRPGPVGKGERDKSLAAKGGKRRTRSVALVLLVDDSGSMQMPIGAPRIEMVKKGAWACASRLGSGDEIALIKFEREARVLLTLGPATRKKELRTALAGLRAMGTQTNCYPGLEAAWRELKRAAGRNPVRHVVVLTDGDFHDKLRGYERLVRDMTREGIGITGIGIYQEKGPEGAGQFVFLRRIMEGAGGHLVLTDTATEIPQLLLGEVELISGARPVAEGGRGDVARRDEDPTERESAKKEDPPKQPPTDPEPTKERRTRSYALTPVDIPPVLNGLEEVGWPRVTGFIPLEAQARTRVHLAVGQEGHTFLATGPFGLGRVAVVAGSDGNPWCAQLVGQEWFPRLVAQLAAWLLPPERLRVPGGPTPMLAARVSHRVLAGDGLEPGLLGEVASRLGGETERAPSRDLGAVRIERAPRAWPWLLGLVGLYLVLLLIEARRRGSVRIA